MKGGLRTLYVTRALQITGALALLTVVLRLRTPRRPSIEVYDGALGSAVNLYCDKLNVTRHRIINVSIPTVGGKQRMSVYVKHDYVVNDLVRLGSWDDLKTVQLLRELRRIGDKAVLLDIGAHIGWFTLAPAYAGFRAVAFEPFEANVGHILHSLCIAPPEVRERVMLLHCGLGIADGLRCELWRNMENFGNSHVLCDSRRRYTPSAVKFGEAHLRRLDTLLERGHVPLRAGDRPVVKIDTEGFEPFTMMGGERLLTEYRPRIIISEYFPPFIMRAARAFGLNETRAVRLPKDYFRMMARLGYSFNVPQWSFTAAPPDVVFRLNQATSPK